MTPGQLTELFPKGRKVRLTVEGRKRFSRTGRKHGTVVGYARYGDWVWVRWDESRASQEWWYGYLKLVKPTYVKT